MKSLCNISGLGCFLVAPVLVLTSCAEERSQPVYNVRCLQHRDCAGAALCRDGVCVDVGPWSTFADPETLGLSRDDQLQTIDLATTLQSDSLDIDVIYSPRWVKVSPEVLTISDRGSLDVRLDGASYADAVQEQPPDTEDLRGTIAIRDEKDRVLDVAVVVPTAPLPAQAIAATWLTPAEGVPAGSELTAEVEASSADGPVVDAPLEVTVTDPDGDRDTLITPPTDEDGRAQFAIVVEEVGEYRVEVVQDALFELPPTVIAATVAE